MKYPSTNNSMRLYADIAQADFVKVGYRLDACKSISKDKSFNRCLYRRESSWSRRRCHKGGAEIALLENVEELKFRYYVANETEGRLEFASNQDPNKDQIRRRWNHSKSEYSNKGKKTHHLANFSRLLSNSIFLTIPKGTTMDQAPLR